MATNDIGRVTPIWRGFFSAATTYELNDIVIDTAGSVWWHKSEELTTGVIPEAGEIWDAVIDMSVFSGLIQAAITTAQTALEAAREAVGEVSADTERAETAARNAETSALNAAESAAGVGAQAQAAERSAEAAADSATGAAGSAEAAAGSKSDAEAYAVGKRSGEDVETTDPTFHNNAKYYSEQAASSADAAAQSAEAAQDVLDSIPADYTQMSKDVGDLKESLNEISEPGVNIGYVTDFDNYKYASGAYVARNNKNQLKIWGTSRSWIRFNLFNGNDEFIAGLPNFAVNLNPGTYTLKRDNTLNLYYGTTNADTVLWKNGTSITIDHAVCVYAQSLTSAENYGTADNPTLFTFEIYNGEVSIIPTAIDNVARGKIALLEDRVDDNAQNIEGNTNDIAGIDALLDEISEQAENICYITEFTGTKSTRGISIKYISDSVLAVWGTTDTWVRINPLMGNSEIKAGTPTFTNNLQEGTYTLKTSDELSVYYGSDWNSRHAWSNGDSITIDTPVMVWLSLKSATTNMGTEESPTNFNIAIYVGNVKYTETANDKIAREKLSEIENAVGETNCDKILAKADFDYNKPYNIFNGTTWIANKSVNYLNGELVDDDTGRLATDYLEIDSSKEYLCVNIYVYLGREKDENLVPGGNRVWVHTAYAFYDANKNFVASTSGQNDTSKAIPESAKYVRLTINQESVIKYAILFYGNFTGQKWVRYCEYRKEIVQYKYTPLLVWNLLIWLCSAIPLLREIFA